MQLIQSQPSWTRHPWAGSDGSDPDQEEVQEPDYSPAEPLISDCYEDRRYFRWQQLINAAPAAPTYANDEPSSANEAAASRRARLFFSVPVRLR